MAGGGSSGGRPGRQPSREPYCAGSNPHTWPSEASPSPCYRQESQGTERSSNLPKVTEFVLFLILCLAVSSHLLSMPRSLPLSQGYCLRSFHSIPPIPYAWGPKTTSEEGPNMPFPSPSLVHLTMLWPYYQRSSIWMGEVIYPAPVLALSEHHQQGLDSWGGHS